MDIYLLNTSHIGSIKQMFKSIVPYQIIKVTFPLNLKKMNQYREKGLYTDIILLASNGT